MVFYCWRVKNLSIGPFLSFFKYCAPINIKESNSFSFKERIISLAIAGKYVVVNIGPGSFTGIRTALTLAKTLQANLNIKVIAVNNFQILRFLNPGIEQLAFRASVKNTEEYFVSLDEDYDNLEIDICNQFTDKKFSNDDFNDIFEYNKNIWTISLVIKFLQIFHLYDMMFSFLKVYKRVLLPE